MKNTLETSGEDVKTTLETSGEDVKITLETSGEDVKATLETSVNSFPASYLLERSCKLLQCKFISYWVVERDVQGRVGAWTRGEGGDQLVLWPLEKGMIWTVAFSHLLRSFRVYFFIFPTRFECSFISSPLFSSVVFLSHSF